MPSIVIFLGSSPKRVGHVRRPVETTEGVKDAIDTVLRAERAAV